MANWEYKVLSSGKHGMATMAALEQHLNDLGQQQWEIITWQTAPDNALLFSGLARRPILRDWKPDEMPAAQAAARAEKPEEEKERDAWRETLKEELEFFSEKENDSEDAEADTEDLLDMLRPMMRRSQRGPGAIGSLSFLARKLEQSDEDLIGALAEAGVALPEGPNAPLTAFEHDNEFYWLNQNQRGEIWLNCGPRPPVTKPLPAPKPERPQHEPRPPAPRAEAAPATERAPVPVPDQAVAPPTAAPAAPVASGAPLPEGETLLNKLRPMMRRNRRGRGWSGSTSFLSRALRHTEEELQAVLAKVGLVLGEDPQGKPVFVVLAGYLYWLNRGQGGQIWINAREHREGEVPGAGIEEADAVEPGTAPAAPVAETPPASVPPAPAEPAPAPVEAAPAPAPVAETGSSPLSRDAIFTTIRPHFTKNKRGTAFSAAPAALAEALGVAQADLVDALVRAGLAVPAGEDDKPVFAEHEDGIFWFNRNAKDELWLNAKAKPARRTAARSGPAKSSAKKKTADESGGE